MSLFVLWEQKGVTNEELSQISNKLLDRDVIVGYIVRTNSTDTEVIEARKTFSISLVIIILEISVIIFCGSYVSRAVNRVSVSDRTRKLQKQILIYHITQTAVVFFCCGTHVTLFTISSALHKSTNFLGTIASAALIWFPTFDFIILCTCLKSYRKTLKRIYQKLQGPGIFCFSNK
ncbi:unnamed protein product [Caenorhabditis angaria]|uniref:Uncharacterized protein n=1 Tax=Caenorhabditis angaria TaxID=860376 RepID=A0A9P1IAZ4_9PELO|nr:unnamed protein product [Caenorhabditis angaria]